MSSNQELKPADQAFTVPDAPLLAIWKTKEEFFDYCRAINLKGEMMCARGCLIARAINIETDRDVEVYGSGVYDTVTKERIFALPEFLFHLIGEFDQGNLPEFTEG